MVYCSRNVESCYDEMTEISVRALFIAARRHDSDGGQIAIISRRSYGSIVVNWLRLCRAILCPVWKSAHRTSLSALLISWVFECITSIHRRSEESFQDGSRRHTERQSEAQSVE